MAGLRSTTCMKSPLRPECCAITTPETDRRCCSCTARGPASRASATSAGCCPRSAAHFRCLVLEFPGFGVSPDLGGHPMIAAHGAAMSFIDALSLDRFDIIGNSMGGGVGINLAIQHPDRVRRLVTIGGIGTNLFTPGPSEGIRLLQEFTEDPTRQRLIDWLNSHGVRPRAGHRRVGRGTLGAWPAIRRPWSPPAGCTARPPSPR